jgi:hypothetical protein
MGLQQVYYTSCRVGLRGGAGFQINAASAGLDEATLRQIERYSLYQPPLHMAYARDRPLSAFPQSLSYYSLNEQVAVLARSVYLGATEADARGGNFFTHSLVALEGPKAFSHVPIQHWGAAYWASEAIGTTELAPLTLPPMREPFSLGSAQQFLQAAHGRLALIGPLVAALLDCLRQQRQLAIVAPADQCANWIAALTLALPTPLVLACTFTTYAREANALPCYIVGLDPESFQTSGRSGLPASSYCFEAATATLNPQPPPSPLATFIAHAYQQHALEQLRGFHEQSVRMRARFSVEEAEAMVRLYAPAETGQLEPADLPALTSTAVGLFDNPETPLEPLLMQISEADTRDPYAMAAAWKLYATASASYSPAAQKVRTWFATWLAELAIPIADTASLQHLSKYFAQYPLVEPMRQQVRVALASRIEEELEPLLEATPPMGSSVALPSDQQMLGNLLNTPPSSEASTGLALLGALLACAETANLHHVLGAEVEQILGLLVRYAPDEPASAALLAERIARGEQHTLDVFCDQLQALATTPQQLARWQAVLEPATGRGHLLQTARRRGNLLLFIYLRGLELPARSGSAQQLAELVDELRRAFAPGPQEQRLIDHYWLPRLFPANEPLARSEAINLLRLQNGAFVQESSLLPLVVDSVLAEPELSKAAYRKLVDKVAEIAEQRKQPGPTLHYLNHLSVTSERITQLSMRQNRSPEDDSAMASEVHELLGLLPERYAALRKQLLAAMLELLLTQEECIAALRRLLAAPTPAESWEVISELLQQRTDPIEQETRFARLFIALAGLQEADGQPAVLLVAKPLRRVWDGLGNVQQKRLEQQLNASADEHVARAWQLWRQRRGIMGLFSR